MRCSVAILLCALLFIPASVSADDAAQEHPLTMLPNKDAVGNEKYRFKMGDSLSIMVTGDTLNKIQDTIKASGLQAIVLQLDGVPMKGLPISAMEEPEKHGKELQLTFGLVRKSDDDDNRKAWDTLLRKQDSWLRQPVPSIAVGNAPAWIVYSPPSFRFYVATEPRIWWTLAVGILVFLIAYCGLIRQTSVMRDWKDGPYSLGKSQMAFWGLLVFLSFLGVWFVTGNMERIPQQVLILLGISAATGLTAVAIGDSKKEGTSSTERELREEKQQLETQKQQAPAPFPPESQVRLEQIDSELTNLSKTHKPSRFFREICSDENGFAFHRIQVVMWTIVLGVIFVFAVKQVISMPEFPETLLLLLGIRAYPGRV